MKLTGILDLIGELDDDSEFDLNSSFINFEWMLLSQPSPHIQERAASWLQSVPSCLLRYQRWPIEENTTNWRDESTCIFSVVEFYCSMYPKKWNPNSKRNCWHAFSTTVLHPPMDTDSRFLPVDGSTLVHSNERLSHSTLHLLQLE